MLFVVEHFSPWVGNTLEEGTATHPSLLAWRIPRTEEAGGATVHGVAVGHKWSALVRTPMPIPRACPRGVPLSGSPWGWAPQVQPVSAGMCSHLLWEKCSCGQATEVQGEHDHPWAWPTPPNRGPGRRTLTATEDGTTTLSLSARPRGPHRGPHRAHLASPGAPPTKAGDTPWSSARILLWE